MPSHRHREQQCGELAESAADPDVRRRLEELAACMPAGPTRISIRSL